MKVTFLGTGTSQGVPVIACGCAVCQSNDKRDKRLRVAMLFETADTTVVIDAGPDFRYQMLRAEVKKLDAIVFTHEHKDHVAGLDDVRAYNYFQRKPMEIYAHPRVQQALKREFSYAFEGNEAFGVPQLNLHAIDKDYAIEIGDMVLHPIEVMHYKLPVLGFRVGDFTYITDAKTITEEEKEKIKGTRILVINALQYEPHISHFTLEEALAFAAEIKAEQTYLTHISHRLGKHADVEKILPSGVKLAYDGLTFDV